MKKQAQWEAAAEMIFGALRDHGLEVNTEHCKRVVAVGLILDHLMDRASMPRVISNAARILAAVNDPEKIIGPLTPRAAA